MYVPSVFKVYTQNYHNVDGSNSGRSPHDALLYGSGNTNQNGPLNGNCYTQSTLSDYAKFSPLTADKEDFEFGTEDFTITITDSINGDYALAKLTLGTP